MSAAPEDRGGLEIVSEILSLTRLMAAKSDDADFLVESVDKRGLLLEEFVRVKASPAKSEIDKAKAEIDCMFGEIRELDKKITRALIELRDEAKLELQNSNTQKKALNYTTNSMMSQSGSYLDIKK